MSPETGSITCLIKALLSIFDLVVCTVSVAAFVLLILIMYVPAHRVCDGYGIAKVEAPAPLGKVPIGGGVFILASWE
jgi:hypothetical protein